MIVPHIKCALYVMNVSKCKENAGAHDACPYRAQNFSLLQPFKDAFHFH